MAAGVASGAAAPRCPGAGSPRPCGAGRCSGKDEDALSCRLPSPGHAAKLRPERRERCGLVHRTWAERSSLLRRRERFRSPALRVRRGVVPLPYAMAIGNTLPVRLVHEGRPLEGAQVVAMSRANPSERQIARTDKSGRVKVQLTREGPWLIKAVHMVRLESDPRAQWESVWASLTFAGPRR